MKLRKKALAMLVVLVLTVVLTGCGSGSVVGTWEMSGSVADELKTTELGEVSMTFEFKAGGDLVVTTNIMGMSQSVVGSWKTADNQIEMTLLDETASGTYKVSGKTLEITIDGEAVVFTKK